MGEGWESSSSIEEAQNTMGRGGRQGGVGMPRREGRSTAPGTRIDRTIYRAQNKNRQGDPPRPEQE
eukprot:scaffold5009_cov103-Isochrysis_galbana.AAC.7